MLNQHTCNRGDEASGRAAIESLLTAFPNATIEVLYNFIGNYPPIWNNTERVKHFPELKLNKNDRIYIIINLLLLILGKRKNFIGSSGKVFDHIQSADIVINAPSGPNLGDFYKDKVYIVFLLIAIISGKNTFMYGSSVGPFKTWWIKLAAKYIFNNMKCVCVRDEISFKYLQELNLRNKEVHCSLDAAVQRKISSNNTLELFKKSNIPINKPLVGVTPLAYQWYPKNIRSLDTQKLIEKNLANILNSLITNNDYNIVFFPQLFHMENENRETTTDLPIIKSIIEKLWRPGQAFIIPDYFDSDCQQSMISNLKFFIGMRYHSVVFSVKMLTPCIGICYEHKTKGFMKKVGLEDVSIDIVDFIKKPEIILEKIAYIEKNEFKIKNSISNLLPELESLSQKGTKLIVSKSGVKIVPKISSEIYIYNGIEQRTI
jgi:polysaccharide pyruvyl transferase WcaK-like protein